MPDEKYIAVLGDLHGHFTLALTILREWERQHGRSLDLILQVGDFGVWPTPYRLDPPTVKFAKRDPDEISFPSYQEHSTDSERFFDPQSPDRINAPLIFIQGNHEDFQHLRNLEGEQPDGAIPVDFYHRMMYLPNGRMITSDGIIIGGLGGKQYDRWGNGFTSKQAKALEHKKLDILLVHEPYKGALPSPRDYKGSPMLRELIEATQPKLVFCGHYHIDGQQLEPINGTLAYILNEVNFRRRHQVNSNCIGILTWNDGDFNFSFLNEPWLKVYKRENYRFVSVPNNGQKAEAEDIEKI